MPVCSSDVGSRVSLRMELLNRKNSRSWIPYQPQSPLTGYPFPIKSGLPDSSRDAKNRYLKLKCLEEPKSKGFIKTLIILLKAEFYNHCLTFILLILRIRCETTLIIRTRFSAIVGSFCTFYDRYRSHMVHFAFSFFNCSKFSSLRRKILFAVSGLPAFMCANESFWSLYFTCHATFHHPVLPNYCFYREFSKYSFHHFVLYLKLNFFCFLSDNFRF